MTDGVPWSSWEPIYEAILADFGFDRGEDELARDELAAALETTATLADLPDATGATVAIAGGGPNLIDEADRAANADVVFAASTAARDLRTAGVAVDVHVTDLDKDVAAAIAHTHAGLPVAIHAHGDNRTVLADTLPRCGHASVLPTTQAEPIGPVLNCGGFTDGDRAAFLADALGAGTMVFPGWDFDDRTVGPVKAKKLGWAETLLYWLERRRDDRFAVLDGRRAAIDTAALPDGAD